MVKAFAHNAVVQRYEVQIPVDVPFLLFVLHQTQIEMRKRLAYSLELFVKALVL